MSVTHQPCKCGRPFDAYSAVINGRNRRMVFCWFCDGHWGGSENRPDDPRRNCKWKGAAQTNCPCHPKGFV